MRPTLLLATLLLFACANEVLEEPPEVDVAIEPLTILNTYTSINSTNGRALDDNRVQMRALRCYIMQNGGASNRYSCARLPANNAPGQYVHRCWDSIASFQVSEPGCGYIDGFGLNCDVMRKGNSESQYFPHAAVDILLFPPDEFNAQYVRLNATGGPHENGERFRCRWSPAKLQRFLP